jgi:hypothetical protein
MNHHDLRTEAVDLSSGGALCVCLDANASGWTVLEARDHDDLMLTRFVPIPYDGMVAAQMALKKANLRGPQRAPVAVGVHARSLVLSIRLPRSTATAGSVDGARAELLRFALACCT